MKIAIDLSPIIYGTGVSHYRENLTRHLLKIDKENKYILFGGSLRRYPELSQKMSQFSGEVSQIKTFPLAPTLADLIWNRLHVLPIEKLIGKIDVIHTSDWAEPPSDSFKVTTVHDLIPIKFPRITPKMIVSTHTNRLKWVAKESKRIIVPSLSTKNDLIELGFDEKIVRVIHEAPNISRAQESEIAEAKKKYGIYGDYIISIGTKPWKNIERVIKAFHLSKSGKSLKLLVVGERKDTKHKDERDVRFLGHIDDGDVSALLSGARALAFPSLYEGFGIPILDGFNCGVPVVTSNISSMPEVAGNAAVLVDPYDINSIADGLEKALNAPKGLIEKGYERVKKFSWIKTAQETLKVYNEAKS